MGWSDKTNRTSRWGHAHPSPKGVRSLRGPKSRRRVLPTLNFDISEWFVESGWMMWNFLVAGLASGSTLVLYDGSPLRDPSLMWNLVDELGITIFGTSAKYIDQLSVRK